MKSFIQTIFTGKSGEKIAYTTETVLKSLLEKGYLLQEDGFPADATFDTDETKVQEYTVLLKHKITVKKRYSKTCGKNDSLCI